MKLALRFDNPDWRGAAVTGIFLQLDDVGILLPFLATALTFVEARAAAICALLGSLLSLPIYLFVIAPRLTCWVFSLYPGRRPLPIFVWDSWALAGVLMLGIVVYLCFRPFAAAKVKSATDAAPLQAP